MHKFEANKTIGHILMNTANYAIKQQMQPNADIQEHSYINCSAGSVLIRQFLFMAANLT